MSHIPSSAMPHAKADHDAETDTDTGSAAPTARERGQEALNTVRANPKAAIAIGAALVAGVAAAFAAPAVFAKSKEPAKTRGGRKGGKSKAK